MASVIAWSERGLVMDYIRDYTMYAAQPLLDPRSSKGLLVFLSVQLFPIREDLEGSAEPIRYHAVGGAEIEGLQGHEHLSFC